MPPVDEFIPASVALSRPFRSVFRLSGVSLLLNCIGVFLLAAAFWTSDRPSGRVLFAVGLCLVVPALAVLGYIGWRAGNALQSTVGQIGPLADVLQRTALHLAQLTSHFQAVADRYMGTLAAAVTAVRKKIQAIAALPGLGGLSQVVDNPALLRAAEVSDSIAEADAEVEKLIADLKSGLASCDVAVLTDCANRIQKIENKFSQMLR